jgi:hypothetical protein
MLIYLTAIMLFPVVLLAQSGLPTYRAARVLDAIQVDGKLDEFTWAAAPRVGRFTNVRNPSQSDPAPTQAAVAWDDVNLYVAFSCVDAEPWGMMKNRDDHLWEEEVVEVFLDPDGDGRNYAEIEVSPHNVVVDLLIPAPRVGGGQAIRWNAEGLRTAVAMHAAGWVVEMAIPWRSLAEAGTERAPRPGDRWRVGLYRIERPGGPSRTKEIASLREKLAGGSAEAKAELQAQIDKLEAGLEWLAWSPTRVERGFHDPERFGVVEFVAKP